MRKVVAVAAGALLGLAALASCSGGGGSQKAELAKLYEKSKSARIRVTYEERDSGGPAPSIWIVSQDGARRSAFIEADAKTVVAGNVVTACENLTSNARCTTTTQQPGAQPTAAFAGMFFSAIEVFQAATVGGGLGKTSKGSVAGRKVRCASVSEAFQGGGGGYEACLDDETGFLMRATVTADNNEKTEIIATKVEEPQPGDFATPTTSTTGLIRQ